MLEEGAKKQIGKLSRAVIILSILCVGLILTILVLFAFKNPEKGGCGVKDDIAVCGGPIYAGGYDGEITQTFNAECASCHFPDKDMVGPAIVGSIERMPYPEYFEIYLKKQDSLLKTSDIYAVDLRENWNTMGTWTHSYDYLDEEEMEGIIRMAKW
jgi:hypothetical protein